MSFVWSGTPATGTYDQNQSSARATKFWESGYANGYIFGAATLTIDSLGPGIDVAGQTSAALDR